VLPLRRCVRKTHKLLKSYGLQDLKPTGMGWCYEYWMLWVTASPGSRWKMWIGHGFIANVREWWKFREAGLTFSRNFFTVIIFCLPGRSHPFREIQLALFLTAERLLKGLQLGPSTMPHKRGSLRYVRGSGIETGKSCSEPEREEYDTSSGADHRSCKKYVTKTSGLFLVMLSFIPASSS
jgi:hypothetical protein